ncbi:integral membrane protein [Fusarium pseudoanthophilum]|uniref:Integral membrane protein n=1 Tax=Fusarium pseudoanthophilum TaxID=48495 RepID=A0A8H5K4C4_9HYPO|nr:integral membrane protein [Fusarium pseudoanthophilum]
MAIATADGLKPSSFPTTLPPAKPSESKDPCAFSDLQQLVDHLEENPALYNTTLLVETCDDICQLVYGTGNPDIWGIGANDDLTQDSKKIAITPEGGWTWRYFPSEQIAKDCDALRGYPSASQFDDAFPQNLGSATGVTILVLLSVSMTLFLLLWGKMPTFARGSMRRHQQRLRQAVSGWCSYIWVSLWGDGAMGRLRPGPWVALSAAAIFAAGLTFAIIKSFMTLQRSRDELRRYVKDEYQDNDWGFGQVLAIAVWVTYLLDAIFLIISRLALSLITPTSYLTLVRRRTGSDSQAKLIPPSSRVSRPPESIGRHLIRPQL